MAGESASPAEAERSFVNSARRQTGEGATAPEARSVRSEYAERLARADSERAALEKQERRLAAARLVVFLAALAVTWLALVSGVISPWWIVAPVAFFVVLVRRFDRTAAARRRASRLIGFHENGLARVENRWLDVGETGERFRAADHPYTEDLDIFGKGSLFQRISLARTADGEATLARWLKAPSHAAEVHRRQGAVKELTPRLDLREDFAVLSGELEPGVRFAGLAAWGAAPRELTGGLARWACALLAIAAMPLLVAWLFFQQSPAPFLVIAAVEAALGAWYFARVRQVLSSIEKRSEELEALSALLARLERETFSAEALVDITSALSVAPRDASARIARLRRLVATLDARRNMIVAPISPFLMWGTQVAMAVEAWRAESGPLVGRWLEAIGTAEALLSLAGYAYENPSNAFPEIAEGGVPRFDAVGLGHSLLPSSRLIRNDVALGGASAPQVLIVSGSNMSGKSTLLRAVGTAAVLAQAGSTVCAQSLRMSPLLIGATLRVQDSLRDGRSRFYAEILRLKQLVEMAQEPPGLLVLLDEILAGTNSHDRRVGAQAVVNGLVNRGAIGLVTTHDLALAEIAQRLGARAANVHFADHFENGVMKFDYRIQPGVVRHSNALALMRSIGLELGPDEPGELP